VCTPDEDIGPPIALTLMCQYDSPDGPSLHPNHSPAEWHPSTQIKKAGVIPVLSPRTRDNMPPQDHHKHKPCPSTQCCDTLYCHLSLIFRPCSYLTSICLPRRTNRPSCSTARMALLNSNSDGKCSFLSPIFSFMTCLTKSTVSI